MDLVISYESVFVVERVHLVTVIYKTTARGFTVFRHVTPCAVVFWGCLSAVKFHQTRRRQTGDDAVLIPTAVRAPNRVQRSNLISGHVGVSTLLLHVAASTARRASFECGPAVISGFPLRCR
jgi:hypothetical protein